MFKRVLIANRGEIAVRVIRSLREMGITSVALFSDADRQSLHIMLADEAYRIGPSPPPESYLNIEKIIKLARDNSIDAIHPGYGFLAENSDFAAACKKAGIVFIGPGEQATRAVGNKILARELAIREKAPVIPGSNGALKGVDDAVREAKKIGFPVMIKAAAGGGGKGMRAVSSENELRSAVELTMGESRSAFGSDEVYIEKFIINPRHIEIQILADSHGNAVHLGERECSLQRRHQKVIEETPSPFIDDPLRKKMGEAALAIVNAAGYTNAGTVEFMVDADKNFYFLEVNARLQVEHPVTEMVTGIDLVKLQIEISAGGKLPFAQDEIVKRGAAIECRICAEDPAKSFLPSTGTISRFQLPEGPGIRNDSGVYEGWEIPVYYDPLIAKLIAWGTDREEARTRMIRALDEYAIGGVRTLLPFHRWALRDREFINGTFDTGFIGRRFSNEALKTAGTDDEEAALIAAALYVRERDNSIRFHEPDNSSNEAHNPWKMAGRIRDNFSK